MIRRSTLVFLTCLGALGAPAVHAQTVYAQTVYAQSAQAAPFGSDVSALSIGSSGQAVETLQVRLSDMGYYAGPIDGIYGLATQRAVVDFQQSQSLEPTGRLDSEARKALETVENVPAERSSEDAATNAATNPSNTVETVDSPTANSSASGEILPVGQLTGVTAAEEPTKNGLSRVLMVGGGLAALAASFGVGFYLANRGKADTENINESEDWSTAESQLDRSTEASNSATVLPLRPQDITQNIAQNVTQNGFSSAGAIASVAAPLRTSGQMGGTTPMAPAEVVDGLIKDLHNPNPSLRRKVIWELGQRGNSLAVQPLVDAMLSADSKEKSLVLAALSEIGIRSLKPMNRALAIALEDDNPEVRKNAIRDLTRIYELVVQISQMLGHATEDEDSEVRQTAAWAVEQLNRIRRVQDVDTSMRSFGSNGPTLRAMGQGQ